MSRKKDLIESLWWEYMLGEIKRGRLTEEYTATLAKESRFNNQSGALMQPRK